MSLLRHVTDPSHPGWLLTLIALSSCSAAQPPPAAVPAAPQEKAVQLGGTTKIEKGPPPPNLRVNQLGYAPVLPKYAVLVTAEKSPLEWQLVDTGGRVLTSGKTSPFGDDADSGDKVQQIDLSANRELGSGLKLRVGKEESPGFDIRPDLYEKLQYDALAYFYHARSGIELKMPYVGDPKYARPAGHLSDQKVPCGRKAGCKYSLDVRGGWYDAGDHGKYVVNGGITVWTLLNQWERTKFFAPARLADFGDGKLRIPENENQIPDLLDEVRWELEFFLKMQVPPGNDQEGMVHHKIHDDQWTSLGGIPVTNTAEIRVTRSLHRVTTTATLNFAATLAQAARVYKEYDAPFAEKCLNAAEIAWRAALKHPNLLADPDDKIGGGAYDDTDVDDEFYWAASELYITTKKTEYKAYLSKSPFYLVLPQGTEKKGKAGPPSPVTWKFVAALGTLSLATVPNDLGKEAIAQARKQVTDRADEYLAILAKQGYRVPLKADEKGQYPWGSNSFIINNALVMALAHDFTGKSEYLTGVVDSMDYLLGVNAMGQSYVSGYGSRPLMNPHHRFFSRQMNPIRPPPPPGCLSGGPNSGLEDPFVQSIGLPGCKPQKCFIDNIESWSTNEITINWNAPLAWVAAYLDEKAKNIQSDPPTPGDGKGNKVKQPARKEASGGQTKLVTDRAAASPAPNEPAAGPAAKQPNPAAAKSKP